MLTAQVHAFFKVSLLHWTRCIGFKQCFWYSEKYAETVMKSNTVIVRTETTLLSPSVDIEWHASVQILQKLKAFMSGTEQQPESSRDRIVFASMFDDITSWESPKVQAKMSSSGKRSSFSCSKIQTWLWGFPWSGIRKENGTNSLSECQANLSLANTLCSSVRSFFKQV